MFKSASVCVLALLLTFVSSQPIDWPLILYNDLTTFAPENQTFYLKTTKPPTTHCPNDHQEQCPFRIQTRLFLVRIHGIDETKQTLHATIRLQLGWNDTRLAWNPEHYGGVSTLIMPGNALWRPDLQLANSVDDIYGLFKDQDFQFKVSSAGEVWYHPTAKVATRCSLDLTYHPWDHQRCAFVIELTTYEIEDMVLYLRYGRVSSEAVQTSMYAENKQWMLVGKTGYPMIYRTSKSTAFSRMLFWVTLKRSPSYVQQTFLVPIALLSLLQLLTLVIPINMVDRVGQSTVVLLSVAVYQGSVTQSLPESTTQSRVAIYLNTVMSMSIASVCLCIVTTALVKPDHSVLNMVKYFKIQRKQKRISVVSISAIDSISVMKRSVTEIREHEAIKRRLNEKARFVAALLNWTSFVIFLFLVVINPCVEFVSISNMEPPALPEPPADSTSSDYFPKY